MLYVDDLICAGRKEIIANVMESLAGRYPMGQMEKSWELAGISYTGMDILFDRKPTGELARVKLNQEAYVKNKFPEAIKELENVLTGSKATAQDLLTPKQADAFRSGNGKLAWAGNTRPQAAYDISELASAAKVPTASDARKLLKVLRAVLENDHGFMEIETKALWCLDVAPEWPEPPPKMLHGHGMLAMVGKGLPTVFGQQTGHVREMEMMIKSSSGLYRRRMRSRRRKPLGSC